MEQGNHQSGQPPDDEEHEQPSGRDQQPWRGQDEGEPSTSGATDMDADMASLDPAKVQRLLRKAETVLSMRTDRILLVLERPFLTGEHMSGEGVAVMIYCKRPPLIDLDHLRMSCHPYPHTHVVKHILLLIASSTHRCCCSPCSAP